MTREYFLYPEALDKINKTDIPKRLDKLRHSHTGVMSFAGSLTRMIFAQVSKNLKNLVIMMKFLKILQLL